MNSYLLYGFSKGKLENLRKMVESALEITLNPHESIYHGGDYYRLNDIGAEHFILQRNLELENELAEDEFPDHSILLYVNETQRADNLHMMLINNIPEITLLRREDL